MDFVLDMLTKPVGPEGFRQALMRFGADNKPDYTAKRDLAADIAPTEPEGALDVARTITEPWFRCQALAYAALYLNDPFQAEMALGESFGAALSIEGEPNRIVSVSAWPLSVLCLKHQWDRVRVEASRLLAVIAEEPSPVRRADALLQIAGAVWDAPEDLLRSVLEPLVAACLAPLASGRRNRRGESWLVHAIPAVFRCSSAWADDVVNRIEGATPRGKAEEALDALRKGVPVPCSRRPSMACQFMRTEGLPEPKIGVVLDEPQ